MLTIPVKDPVGNWQEVTVGNTCTYDDYDYNDIDNDDDDDAMTIMMIMIMTMIMTRTMIGTYVAGGVRSYDDHDGDGTEDHNDDGDDDYDRNDLDLTSRAHHIGTYSWRGEKIVHCA